MSEEESSEDEDSSQDDDDKMAPPAKRKKLELSVSLLNQIRLSRVQLEKLITEPHFEEAVKGAYVRVNLGENRNRDGQTTYRIGMVEQAKKRGEDSSNYYVIEKK